MMSLNEEISLRRLYCCKASKSRGDAKRVVSSVAMGVRMSKTSDGTLQREGVDAFVRMDEALQLLDRCEGAAAIGAQLDLAISRLEEMLNHAGVATPPRQSSQDLSV